MRLTKFFEFLASWVICDLQYVFSTEIDCWLWLYKPSYLSSRSIELIMNLLELQKLNQANLKHNLRVCKSFKPSLKNPLIGYTRLIYNHTQNDFIRQCRRASAKSIRGESIPLFLPFHSLSLSTRSYFFSQPYDIFLSVRHLLPFYGYIQYCVWTSQWWLSKRIYFMPRKKIMWFQAGNNSISVWCAKVSCSHTEIWSQQFVFKILTI